MDGSGKGPATWHQKDMIPDILSVPLVYTVVVFLMVGNFLALMQAWKWMAPLLERRVDLVPDQEPEEPRRTKRERAKARAREWATKMGYNNVTANASDWRPGVNDSVANVSTNHSFIATSVLLSGFCFVWLFCFAFSACIMYRSRGSCV